jgi:hypothetical protein
MRPIYFFHHCSFDRRLASCLWSLQCSKKSLGTHEESLNGGENRQMLATASVNYTNGIVVSEPYGPRQRAGSSGSMGRASGRRRSR